MGRFENTSTANTDRAEATSTTAPALVPKPAQQHASGIDAAGARDTPSWRQLELQHQQIVAEATGHTAPGTAPAAAPIIGSGAHDTITTTTTTFTSASTITPGATVTAVPPAVQYLSRPEQPPATTFAETMPADLQAKAAATEKKAEIKDAAIEKKAEIKDAAIEKKAEVVDAAQRVATQLQETAQRASVQLQEATKDVREDIRTVAVGDRAEARAVIAKYQAKAREFYQQVQARVGPYARRAWIQIEPHARRAQAQIKPYAARAQAQIEPYVQRARVQATPYIERGTRFYNQHPSYVMAGAVALMLVLVYLWSSPDAAYFNATDKAWHYKHGELEVKLVEHEGLMEKASKAAAKATATLAELPKEGLKAATEAGKQALEKGVEAASDAADAIGAQARGAADKVLA